MKYQPGDKVYILPHEHGGCEKSTLLFQTRQSRHGKSMADYVGSVAKISSIHGDTYHLDIDHGDWHWGECMLSTAPKYDTDQMVSVLWGASPYHREPWNYGRVVRRYQTAEGEWVYVVRADDMNHQRTFYEGWISPIATTCSPEGSTLTIPKLEEMMKEVKGLLDDRPPFHFEPMKVEDLERSKYMNHLLDYQWKDMYKSCFGSDWGRSPITDWMKDIQDTKKERSPMKYKVGDRVEITDSDDLYYKKTGVINKVDADDDDLPYRVEFGEDDTDWYEEESIKIISKKGGLMSRLTILAKKVLDKDLRDLLKAGVLNEDLSINDSRFVLDFVVANFKKELAEAAREKLAEMKEESDEE